MRVDGGGGGASQLGIRAYVYEHQGLGGHGSRTCSYGIMPRFMITRCLIDLVSASQLGIRA